METTDPDLVDRIDEQIFGSPRRTGFGALTGLGSGDRKGPDFADARFDTDVPADAIEPVMLDPSTQGQDSEAHHGAETPEFVRSAEREARWQSSGARKMLRLMVVVLALLLAGQAANHFRDTLAARWPAARPALHGRLRGARLPHRGAAPHRGHRRREQRVDARRRPGRCPAPGRRAAQPRPADARPAPRRPEPDRCQRRADRTPGAGCGGIFAATDASLPAAGETTLRALLADPGGRVAGYTVELFYP